MYQLYLNLKKGIDRIRKDQIMLHVIGKGIVVQNFNFNFIRTYTYMCLCAFICT